MAQVREIWAELGREPLPGRVVNPKGRYRFSEYEIKQIRSMLNVKFDAGGNEQKQIRGRLRDKGFYISDFYGVERPFTVSDLDWLIDCGIVEVLPSPPSKTQKTSRKYQMAVPSTSPMSSPPGPPRPDWGSRSVAEDFVQLPDYLSPNLRVVFCGTAAGSRSASISHYYAGQGNEFWSVLFQSGLTPIQLLPDEDARVLEFGLGLTDLVKTDAGMDASIAAAYYDVPGFISKIERYGPQWVAFHGKNAAKVYLREQGKPSNVPLGPQNWRVGNARVFVLPSASAANRRGEYEGQRDRLSWFRKFAELLDRDHESKPAISRLASKTTTSSVGRLTLHEAMVLVLRVSGGGWMDRDRLAAEIARQDLYRRRDGDIAPGDQMRLRARKYPHLFECSDERCSMIRLVRPDRG